MAERYAEGYVVVIDSQQFSIVNVAAPGQLPCLCWASTDGGFYPIGTGPELSAAERYRHRLCIADLIIPRWWQTR